ncbi:hypothetical protein [Arthrobacter oryzae]|uniref:hypothetical protein n=1 Tax=Arthrobacter oryzae TaxID=409290 RepID=UPI00285F1FC6|nr:hypothetical protein [Arthrobacter oryzae]MDR6505122.1 hypothetical protein [Arthrobacter oryzae]
MMKDIKEAFRRFVARNIIADDPYPVRSWLDQQNMPPETRPNFTVPVQDANGWQH